MSKKLSLSTSTRKKGLTLFDARKGIIPKTQNSLSVTKNKKSDLIVKAKQEQKMYSQELDILFGLDYTISTLEIINEFQKSVNEIVRLIKNDYRFTKFYYGKYDGSGKHKISAEGDSDFLNRKNIMGNSDVPKFLKLIKKKNIFEESKNPFVFLFGDELSYWKGDFSQKDLDNAIAYFKQKKINLFFLYEQGGGGTSKKYLIKKLINPLGEQAMLLDFSSTNAKDLVTLLKGCISYVVRNNISSVFGTNGNKQISLSNHLKSLGVANVPQITAGDRKLLE